MLLLDFIVVSFLFAHPRSSNYGRLVMIGEDRGTLRERHCGMSNLAEGPITRSSHLSRRHAGMQMEHAALYALALRSDRVRTSGKRMCRSDLVVYMSDLSKNRHPVCSPMRPRSVLPLRKG
jgi:hypothetical protein